MAEMAEKLPYSYHTFMFPFIWNKQKGSEEWKFDDFEKNVLNTDYWKKTTWDKPSVVPPFAKEEKNPVEDWEIRNANDQRLRYANIQYFHKPVQNAMRPSPKNVVQVWYFLPKQLHDDGKYIIYKNGVVYALQLNAIFLKLYNTGIGVIVFETENYDYKSIKDFKWINDYGRRISLPILSKPEGGYFYTLTADKIELRFKDLKNCEKSLVTDFSDQLRRVYDQNDKNFSMTHYSERMGLPEIIKDLLQYGKKDDEKFEIFTEYQTATISKKPLYLQAILDDRMYVCCLIRNQRFMDRIIGQDQKMINQFGYSYQQLNRVDESIAGELYAFIYVDPRTSTCENRFMQRELLDKSIYGRWIEYGTLQAVTHHSLMCITGDDPFRFVDVINPFLNLYIEMALLVLVQRATIIRLEHEAADLSENIGQESKTIQMPQIKKLMDLQEKYVAFQNELLFFEVTAQEQGIEIYEKLQEEMYIEKEVQKLDNHLEALYEATNVNQDYRFNKVALIFAIIALVFTIAPVIVQPLFTATSLIQMICVGILIFLGVCLSIIIPMKKFSRKGRKKR